MSDTSIAIGSPRPGLRALLGEIPYDKPRTRLLDVDAARGLAIFLVVVGHVVARDMPADNEWYGQLKHAIYLFHMPLFMVLTGITFALSLPRFQAWSAVARFSWRRVERLFIPYLVFGLLVLVGKWAASAFLYVDNMPKGWSRDFFMLLFFPAASVASFLWFIYVLSIYLLIVPALFQIFGRRPMPLLIVGVALQFGAWPQLFMLDCVVEYLPFFALGMLLWMCRGAWARITPGLLWSSSALFAALLATSVWLEPPKWLVGAASVPAVLAWMQSLPPRPQAWLAVLGRASLAIYLMNTIAIGLTKGVMLKFLPWDGVNFLLYFPLLTLAGIAAPILILQLATRYFPSGARYLK
ncbi:MAG TPA: acyltransferase [Burkholderiales bacterium]|nr:acyltransferase [Burkholderiales bacterium]